MGEHRPARARDARRHDCGAARGGGGTGDPDVRRNNSGAAGPRRRPGGGAGAHRLALYDPADAGKRGRSRARQDRARWPAATAVGRVEERDPSRGGGDGTVHQPRPQGGRAHRRGRLLSRRRGDYGRPHCGAAQGLLRRGKPSRRSHQCGLLQVCPPRDRAREGRPEAARAAPGVRALQAHRHLRHHAVRPNL